MQLQQYYEVCGDVTVRTQVIDVTKKECEISIGSIRSRFKTGPLSYFKISSFPTCYRSRTVGLSCRTISRHCLRICRTSTIDWCSENLQYVYQGFNSCPFLSHNKYNSVTLPFQRLSASCPSRNGIQSNTFSRDLEGHLLERICPPNPEHLKLQNLILEPRSKMRSALAMKCKK